ncbi:MAG: endonuclease III [Planctomycetes bacterium]|nr:endonuclease III [Planctomycetota bacterium]
MEPLADKKARVKKVIAKLGKAYPDARCLLDHTNPLELLVATILAAQCTDERVNKTTPALFARFKSATDFAAAPIEELEGMIRSCGTFRNKARAIVACCKELVEKHGGQVPAEMEVLSNLPGVGRKTANVVLANCFGVPGIIVDTHMIRVAGRLGLADPHNVEKKYAEKIEKELAEAVLRKDWTLFSHLMTFHGRRCCYARKPECPRCVVNALCPYPDKTPEDPAC